MSSMTSKYFLILPKEILLCIRSFLVAYTYEKTSSMYNTYEIEDGKRSWNALISVRNDIEWKSVRKETLVLMLNVRNSLKYVEDESFRSLIHEKIADPYHQLALIFDELPETKNKWMNRLYLLQITDKKFTSIDSLSTIQHVRFSFCSELKSISFLEGITKLSINYCSSLHSVKGPNLEALDLDTTRLTNLKIPLENLKYLQCPVKILGLFDLKTLVSLKSLIIHGEPFWKNPTLQIPNTMPLEIFQTHFLHLPEIDFSSFSNLKKVLFTNSGTRPFTHINEFFQKNLHLCSSKLKSFSASNLSLPKDVLLTHLPTIQEFKIYQGNFQDCELYVSDNIHELDLEQANLRHIYNLSPEKRYLHVNLSSCHSLQPSILQIFSSTYYLNLTNCRWVVDISPLANIPHLYFNHCISIQDFSCLGKQLSLSLSDCRNIKHSDLERLSSVRYLNIDWCPGISDISMLRDNLVISACFLPDLTKVVLLGENYRRVRLFGRIRSIDIQGKVLRMFTIQETKIIHTENVTEIDYSDNNF